MGIFRDIDVFSPNQYEDVYYEAPIIAKRAPKVSDKEEVGKVWIDTVGDDAYFLTSITGGSAIWINAGGGTGTFSSVTASTGNITATLGDFVASAGNLAIAGTVTFGAFSAGVLSCNGSGVVTSTTGTDGQILINSTAGVAAWANITAGAGIVVTDAAGAITITATGAIASTFPTDSGTATPAAGATTVAGGTNINTSGAAATITVNLDNTVSVSGALTAGVDLNMASGRCTITSDNNSSQSIYLHADAGTSETIDIYSDQGTSATSINIHSDEGGVTLASGFASADAININASDAAGGIDVDFGTGGLSLVGANGAINLESGTAAINVGVDAAAHTVTVGSTNTTAATVIQSGTGDVVVTSTDAVTIDAAGILEINSSAGIIGIGNDAVAQNINIGIGAAARTITIGNSTAGTGLVLTGGNTGDTLLTPATVSGAGAALTLNAKIGSSTHTGVTTAAAAQETFTITNSEVSETSAMIVTVTNIGAADARMSLERVKQAAGSFTVDTQNNGAAQLNGNVVISWIVLS